MTSRTLVRYDLTLTRRRPLAAQVRETGEQSDAFLGNDRSASDFLRNFKFVTNLEVRSSNFCSNRI